MCLPVKRRFFALLLALASMAFQSLRADTPAKESTAVKSTVASKAPTPVIFDSDMYSDIDDMLALAMLHALQDRREINLLAVTITTEDPWAASYVDLVNTFYGHPNVAIGLVRDGMTDKETLEKVTSTSPNMNIWKVAYTQMLSERRKANGQQVYPHKLADGSQAPEAVALLRKTLAAQADGSVVIVQVGFSTNLARLLDSRPDASSPFDGPALVKKKVKLLSVMAGNFAETKHPDGKISPKGTREFNLAFDVTSAQKLFAEWPTPVVASGFEIGLKMLFPAASIENDFSYVRDHPVAESYRYYAIGSIKWPHDHPTFDLTSVLYAARPDRNYFSLSKPGKITVLPDGGSQFEENEQGLHRYMIVNDEQQARTLEAMVMLASQPPRGAK